MSTLVIGQFVLTKLVAPHRLKFLELPDPTAVLAVISPWQWTRRRPWSQNIVKGRLAHDSRDRSHVLVVVIGLSRS